MRYISIVLTPTEEYIRSQNQRQKQGRIRNPNPREIWIDGTRVATQEAVHYNNLLDDGSAVAVVQFRGDADRVVAIVDETPEIRSCTVTGGETWLAYMHYDPEAVERTLFELVDTEAISIDWPVRFTAEGIQLTLFGEDTALQHTIANVPDEMDLRLERAGEYQPDLDDPAADLTDRQTDTVRAAIAAGYYDIPRRATQQDLAADLGLSQATIGEHLRRAEAKIIPSVVV